MKRHVSYCSITQRRIPVCWRNEDKLSQANASGPPAPLSLHIDSLTTIHHVHASVPQMQRCVRSIVAEIKAYEKRRVLQIVTPGPISSVSHKTDHYGDTGLPDRSGTTVGRCDGQSKKEVMISDDTCQAYPFETIAVGTGGGRNQQPQENKVFGFEGKHDVVDNAKNGATAVAQERNIRDRKSRASATDLQLSRVPCEEKPLLSSELVQERQACSDNSAKGNGRLMGEEPRPQRRCETRVDAFNKETSRDTIQRPESTMWSSKLRDTDHQTQPIARKISMRGISQCQKSSSRTHVASASSCCQDYSPPVGSSANVPVVESKDQGGHISLGSDNDMESSRSVNQCCGRHTKKTIDGEDVRHLLEKKANAVLAVGSGFSAARCECESRVTTGSVVYG